MRFGNWRGAAAALALLCALARPASAGDLEDYKPCHTIPRLVPAMDLNTGQQYYAPPIPYGHYVGKQHGAKALGLLGAPVAKAKGLLHHGNKGCHHCGGAGCGMCGGGHGGGLFHHGGGGGACGSCGGGGCGACGGTGIIGGPGGVGDSFVVHDAACGRGHGHGHKHGHGHGGDFGAGSPVMATSQEVACGACGGQGCGLCHGRGRACGNGDARLCGGGDPSCGDGGAFDPCGACGGKGCGLCHGLGKLCKACGGKGCALCKGLKSKLLGSAAGLLGIGNIKYFVGAGGPVPLTPGYVPYVVTTRSPRDFFAFPPFSNVDP